MATATRRHALTERVGAEVLFERDGTDDQIAT